LGRTITGAVLRNIVLIGVIPDAQLLRRIANRTMPSLFRFLLVLGVLGGLTYGAIFALATFVNPKPREITVTIPPDKFLKR
jgi:hypothetical protein